MVVYKPVAAASLAGSAGGLVSLPSVICGDWRLLLAVVFPARYADLLQILFLQFLLEMLYLTRGIDTQLRLRLPPKDRKRHHVS